MMEHKPIEITEIKTDQEQQSNDFIDCMTRYQKQFYSSMQEVRELASE